MAASFYESLEEKSSRLFFLLGDGCWVLGVDEVLVGQKLQYYIGLIRLIGLMADKANSAHAQRLIVFYWANRFYLANKVIRG